MKVLYRREVVLRDVYVEGQFDRTIVKVFFNRKRCKSAVYEIDKIDIPNDILQKHGLNEGSNKARVIALCLELEPHVLAEQVTGVVDRDFDRILSIVHKCSVLVVTDFSCMEMYFFESDHLERFCLQFVQSEDNLAVRLMGMLTPVLQALFFIRATNEALNLGLTWIDAAGQCDARKGGLDFDADEFVQKYLSKGSLLSQKNNFTRKLNELRTQADLAECRHQMHGHDFVALLAKCLHPIVKAKSLADPDVIERVLPAFADFDVLGETPLFKTLLQRASY